MAQVPNNFQVNLVDVARLEDRLAASLHEMASEVDHVDCFDQEQRAEIYSILHALKTDSQAHRSLLGSYVSEPPEVSDD